MALPMDPVNFVKILASWYRKYQGVQRPYVCDMPQNRIIKAHRIAFESLKTTYGKLVEPSPFKKSACLCVGIMEALPLQLSRIPDQMAIQERDANISAIMDNAKLALGTAMYVLDRSEFSCAKDFTPPLLPPYGLELPSKHFTGEFLEALAGKGLSVQGVALSLELIFYLSENGGRLRGCVDKQLP